MSALSGTKAARYVHFGATSQDVIDTGVTLCLVPAAGRVLSLSRRLGDAATVLVKRMVALKSWEEFELHVRAGFEHELSLTELKELLMLAAIYCGVPAANTAFGHAKKIIGS